MRWIITSSIWRRIRMGIAACRDAELSRPGAVSSRIPEHDGQLSGDGGQHSAQAPKCPSSHRNGVRHAAGMLSAITPGIVSVIGRRTQIDA
jgi:hypothetical protein